MIEVINTPAPQHSYPLMLLSYLIKSTSFVIDHTKELIKEYMSVSFIFKFASWFRGQIHRSTSTTVSER